MVKASMRHVIFLLFILAFCFKAYNLDKNPLQYDGTLYAVMISEAAENPGFLPTYLGKLAPWKPATYFIAYSFFLPITTQLFDSIDHIYKFPNLVFGLLNALIFYFISKRFASREAALAAALLFYASYGVLYTESRLLMEAFALTPILLSIFFYTAKELSPAKRFAGAGIFALLACLTKIVISFMVIPIALAYVLQHDRKSLCNPLFLLSLLAPLLGMLIFYLALEDVGLAEDILMKDTGKFFFVIEYLGEMGSTIFYAIIYFIVMFGLYLFVSARKMLESWSEYLLFTVWMLVSLVPIFSGEPHHWYFYYVAPAISFFVAVSLTNKGRLDGFSLVLIAILVFSSFAMVVLSDLQPEPYFDEGRETGIFMAGKENVLIIGRYAPVTMVTTYKILSEKQESGSYLDFGYVILASKATGKMNATEYVSHITGPFNAVAGDYKTEAYQFEEEDFASMFRTEEFIRKKTGIAKFDYIVVSPSALVLEDPGYQLIRNGSQVAVYQRLEEP